MASLTWRLLTVSASYWGKLTQSNIGDSFGLNTKYLNHSDNVHLRAAPA